MDCVTTFGCGWCDYGVWGVCSVSSGDCNGTWDTLAGQCPNPTPPPSPYPDSNGSYPSVGIAAIVLIALTSLLTAARMLLYACAKSWHPVYGSRLIAGMVSPRDYTTAAMRILPVILICLSLGMKITSLSLDQWDTDSGPADAGITATVYFGVLKWRVSFSGDVLPSQSESYMQECDDIADDSGAADISNALGLCLTKRIAGIFTLMAGICATIFALLLCVSALNALAFKDRFSASVLHMWRFAGFTLLYTTATLNYWIWGGHMIIHHSYGDATYGASWIMMIVTWVFDLIVLIFYRQAVQHTIDPARSAADAGLAYAPLNPPRPVIVQAQPATAVGPPQAPFGYGSPQPQLQHNPQYYVAAHQQQQYAPYAGQQQQPQRYEPPQYAAPPVMYGAVSASAHAPPRA
jgi:hypothetical protein